jgi:hypothetical protein
LVCARGGAQAQLNFDEIVRSLRIRPKKAADLTNDAGQRAQRRRKFLTNKKRDADEGVVLGVRPS